MPSDDARTLLREDYVEAYKDNSSIESIQPALLVLKKP